MLFVTIPLAVLALFDKPALSAAFAARLSAFSSSRSRAASRRVADASRTDRALPGPVATSHHRSMMCLP